MNTNIGTKLPLSSINRETIGECTGAVGHPANLHMWWGRSPQASTLAALNASVDTDNDKPTVFDPFSGYGGIPLAAQKLGFPVIAGDLNPVAVLLTKAATEIPSKFKGMGPAHKGERKLFYENTCGLAEDVEYYGEWLFKKASEKLARFYPIDPDGVVSGWIWARTVKCPNPACGCDIPMASSFVLDGRKKRETWADPVFENGRVRFDIHEGICPEEKFTSKFGNHGARFRCPACGEITTDAYVKDRGRAHELPEQLMAVVIDGKRGRIYKSADEVQISAANISLSDDLPAGTIPENASRFSPPGFGFTEYADLFTNRQMCMLTTFSDLLEDVRNKVASDALAAGFSPEGGPLENDGAGALAYGQAISIYLAFVIDKMVDRNTNVCSWNASEGNSRATFCRRSIPMTWNFFESNPFSDIAGNFRSALKSVVAAMRSLPCGNNVDVYQGNAITADFPENVLVCTELPYYSSIGYAHLSDFFYIWLRRSLKPAFPELFSSIVVPKEELSTASQYYGVDKADAEQKYREEMNTVMEKLFKCSSDQYPSLLFFEYHKADRPEVRNADASDGLSNWEAFLDSVIKAGFSIDAVWPMRNEVYSESADATRVLTVCSKKGKETQITRRNFINVLKRELPEKLGFTFSEEVDEIDKPIVAMGQALQIFTRYKRVINADGSPMNVKDALLLIHQETENIMAKQESESQQAEDEI